MPINFHCWKTKEKKIAFGVKGCEIIVPGAWKIAIRLSFRLKLKKRNEKRVQQKKELG